MADPKISEIVNKSNQIVYPKTQVAAILDWDTQWNAKAVSENLVNTNSLNSILNNYASANDLAITASIVSDLATQIDTLDTTLAAIPVTYVSKAELGNEVANLGIPTVNALDNFYTKSEIDNGFATVSTLSGYYTKTQANTTFMTASSLSSTLGNYYTASQADNRYAMGSNVYTKTEVYAKNETDALFYTQAQINANYYNRSQVYTKDEVDAQVAAAASGGTIDLNGYVTTSDLTSYLNTNSYITSSYLTNNDYVVSTELDNSFSSYLDNNNYLNTSSSTSNLRNNGNGQLSATTSMPYPFLTEPDLSTVALTGDYNDLSGKPAILSKKMSFETVGSSLTEANLFTFNDLRINSTNFSSSIFIVICHVYFNNILITNGWAVMPGLQLAQQLFSSDSAATIYPVLAYGSSGSRNLGVKMAGIQSGDSYPVDVFILNTK